MHAPENCLWVSVTYHLGHAVSLGTGQEHIMDRFAWLGILPLDSQVSLQDALAAACAHSGSPTEEMCDAEIAAW